MILDYLRITVRDSIGGVNFVGGVTKLGGDEATSVLTADFLSPYRGFFSVDAEESVRSLGALLRLCFARELSSEERYLMLGIASAFLHMSVRRCFRVPLNNDASLPKLRKPY